MSKLEVTGDPIFQLASSSSCSSSTTSLSSQSSFDFSDMLGFDFDMTDLSASSSPMGDFNTSSDCLSMSPDFAITDIVKNNDISLLYFSSSPRETMLLFRTVFLAHRTQLGLYMPEPKLDALRCGDMTGLLIDPIIVHIVQLWGCFLCHRSESEEAIQLQAALNFLNENDSQIMNDPTTSIQAQSLLALYFLAKGDMYRGREHLLKANNVVMKYNLHIVDPTIVVSNPDPDSGGECSWMLARAELQEERLVALYQLIYLDKCADLVINFPTLFTGDIDQELQDINVTACGASIIVQQTRSISYLQQAKKFLTQWNVDRKSQSLAFHYRVLPAGTNSEVWYSKYWDLMRKIYIHQADFRPAILRASFSFDHEINMASKLCHILTLTALAYLHDILAPNHPEARRSCRDAVVDIVRATESIADDDYSLMDPVITICWTFVADVLQRKCYGLDLSTETDFASMVVVLQNSTQRLNRVVPYVLDIRLS